MPQLAHNDCITSCSDLLRANGSGGGIAEAQQQLRLFASVREEFALQLLTQGGNFAGRRDRLHCAALSL